MKTPKRAGLGIGPLPTPITPTQATRTSLKIIVTPKPELVRRSNALDVNDPRFIGWQTTGRSVVQRACGSGYTYSESGSYWNCCPTTGDCSFATNCMTYGATQYEVFPNGDTSLCGTSTHCWFDYVYTVVNDPSPMAFVGCASVSFHALRTAHSIDAIDWDYTTPPRPSTILLAPGFQPTASSDQIPVADHSIQLGLPFNVGWNVKLTPLTGGLLAGAFLFLIFLCWLGGIRRRRNMSKKKSQRPTRPFYNPFEAPPNPNFDSQPPPYDPAVFPHQHELNPLPIHNMYDPRPQGLGGGILGGGQSQYARLPGEEVQDGFSPNTGQTTGIIEGPGTGAATGGGDR